MPIYMGTIKYENGDSKGESAVGGWGCPPSPNDSPQEWGQGVETSIFKRTR